MIRIVEIDVHERGYRISLDFEEASFRSPRPIIEYLRKNITKEELLRRQKKVDIGKVVATILIDFPSIEIKFHDIPEKKWRFFLEKSITYEIRGEEIPGTIFLNYRPSVRFPYVNPDDIEWIIENFRKFREDIMRLAGVK